MPLYLIHLDPPFKHAGHYLGYVQERADMTVDEAIFTRLDYHRRGRGSKLLKAATAAGCQIKVVR